MYIDDKEYQDKVYESKHILKVFFDGKEIDSKYILGCERRHILFENNEFCFGSTPAQTVELKIHKKALPEMISRVEIISGIPDKEFPIGQFNIDKIEHGDDSTVDLSLIDDMIKFEFNYDTNIFNKGYATLREIAEDICKKGGVEFGSTSFLSEETKVYVYDNTVSARTFLGYIAEQASAFAMIGRDGKLYFKTIEIPNPLALIKIQMNMNDSVLESIIPTRYKDRVSFDFDTEGKLICKIDNTMKEIKDVIMDEDGNVQLLVDTEYYIKTKAIDLPVNLFEKYKFSNEFIISRVRYENGVEVFEKGVTDFNTLYISQENMYITEQSQIDKIYDKCDGLDIYSFEGSSIIDPAIELGDILKIDGKYVLYQGSQKFGGRWKADINIEIMSKQKEETTTKTSNKALIRRLQSRINEQDGKIEMIAKETEGYNEIISNQTIEIGKIKQSVEQVVDFTKTVEGINPLKLENCMNGELQYLSINGTENNNEIHINTLNQLNKNYYLTCRYSSPGGMSCVLNQLDYNILYPIFYLELKEGITYHISFPFLGESSDKTYNAGTFSKKETVGNEELYCIRYLGTTNYSEEKSFFNDEMLTEVIFTATAEEKFLLISTYPENLVNEDIVIKKDNSEKIELGCFNENLNNGSGYITANLDIVNHQYNTGLSACKSTILSISPNTEYTVLKAAR